MKDSCLVWEEIIDILKNEWKEKLFSLSDLLDNRKQRMFKRENCISFVLLQHLLGGQRPIIKEEEQLGAQKHAWERGEEA